MAILVILAILCLLGIGLFISRSEASHRKKVILCIGIPSWVFFLFVSFIILIAIPGSGDTAGKNWIREILEGWGLMTSWAILWGIIVGSIVFGVWTFIEYLKHKPSKKQDQLD